MPNAKYIKGVALEREVVNAFKEVGCKAWRSAGSHGVYDLQVIGSLGQLVNGWWKLDTFKHGHGCRTRVGKKYIDKLFFKEYASLKAEDDRALFIQCKRKEK